MKKMICVILSLLIMLSIVGCNDRFDISSSKHEESSSSTETSSTGNETSSSGNETSSSGSETSSSGSETSSSGSETSSSTNTSSTDVVGTDIDYKEIKSVTLNNGLTKVDATKEKTFAKQETEKGTITFLLDKTLYGNRNIVFATAKPDYQLAYISLNNSLLTTRTSDYFTVTDCNEIEAVFISKTECSILVLDENNRIIYFEVVKKGSNYQKDFAFEFLEPKSINKVINGNEILKLNRNDDKRKISINAIDATLDKQSYEFLDTVNVQCSATNFAYYMIEDEIVSYNRNYSFCAVKNATIKAVLTDDVTPAPLAHLMKGIAVIQDRIFVSVTIEVPAGAEVIEEGIYYSSTKPSNKGEHEQCFLFDVDSAVKAMNLNNNAGFYSCYAVYRITKTVDGLLSYEYFMIQSNYVEL